MGAPLVCDIDNAFGVFCLGAAAGANGMVLIMGFVLILYKRRSGRQTVEAPRPIEAIVVAPTPDLG
jgi:hypothetical protein